MLLRKWGSIFLCLLTAHEVIARHEAIPVFEVWDCFSLTSFAIQHTLIILIILESSYRIVA